MSEYDARGQRAPRDAARFSVSILMPSSMSSSPHECDSEEEAIKLATSWASEMKSWKNFEAWLLLFEGGKEVSREHIQSA